MVDTSIPKAVPGNHNSIAAQYERAKAIRDADEKKRKEIRERQALGKNGKPKSVMQRLNEKRVERFGREWAWAMGFFAWLL